MSALPLPVQVKTWHWTAKVLTAFSLLLSLAFPTSARSATLVVAANTTGGLASFQLNATAFATNADLGRQQAIYVAALTNTGSIILYDGTGWTPFTDPNTTQPFFAGALPKTVNVQIGPMDASPLKGAYFFLLYGTNLLDAVQSGNLVLLGDVPVNAGPVVMARSFGAKGDGVSDDAPAIQRALDSIPQGGTVVLDAGTFMLGTSAGGVSRGPDDQVYPDTKRPIESALIIRNSNTTLAGQGKATVLQLAARKKLRMLVIDRASNVSVQDMVFDGNKSARDGSRTWPYADVVDGLVYGNVTNALTYLRLEVRNGLEDGLGAWLATGTLAINCDSHDNGNDIAGATGFSLSGGGRNRILASESRNNTSTGVWLAYGLNHVEVRESIIRDNQGAGITIGGNTLELGGGLNRNYALAGNTISNNGSFGYPAVGIYSATDGVMDNNQVVNNAFTGIEMPAPAPLSGNAPSTGWVFTNNLIGNTDGAMRQQRGIYIGARNSVALRANTLQNNGLGLEQQAVVDAAASLNADWRNANNLSFKQPAIADDLAPPVVRLELPKPSSSVAGAQYAVAGFAYDGVSLDRVEVYIDAVLAGKATIRLPRPDVAQAIPYAPADCGYDYKLDSTRFANGTHTVTVKAVDSHGNVSSASATVTFSN